MMANTEAETINLMIDNIPGIMTERQRELCSILLTGWKTGDQIKEELGIKDKGSLSKKFNLLNKYVEIERKAIAQPLGSYYFLYRAVKKDNLELPEPENTKTNKVKITQEKELTKKDFTNIVRDLNKYITQKEIELHETKQRAMNGDREAMRTLRLIEVNGVKVELPVVPKSPREKLAEMGYRVYG